MIGDDRPYNVALIVLDPDVGAGLRASRRESRTSRSSPWRPRRRFSRRSRRAVEHGNADLTRVEQIKRFKVLPDRLAAGGRRADTDDEAQTAPARAQVRGRDRGDVLGVTSRFPRVTRLSQAFLPTLKDAPADAEAISHKLMVRAGLDPPARGRALDLPAGWMAGRSARSRRSSARRWRRSAARRC